MPKGQILVVEDEHITALDIQKQLTNLGYTVSAIASSGEQAIRAAARLRPDLVLMDIKLKGDVDGVEVANQIRTRFDIPVVYLTAFADDTTLQRAKVTEPYGYVTKPFTERDLVATVEMVLYKRSMEKKLRESERWLATTLKSIGDALIATDAQGQVKFMNPVAEALTGWKQAEALGKDLSQIFRIIIPGESQPSGESPAMKVLRVGTAIYLRGDTLLIARDGTQIPIDDSAAPIMDENGNLAGVVLVFQDVTDRKRAEQELDEYRDHLEDLVEARTSELKKANQKLEQQVAERKRAEEQVQASLREKEVLLQEIHHRVKNNLQVISSLLDMQSRFLGDRQALQVLQESRNRVRSMAFVHERLYQSQDLARIDISEYVRSIVGYLSAVYGNQAAKVTLNIHVDDVSLDMDTAIPCGLIINELVSNALKYAFPPSEDMPSNEDSRGEICIEIRSEDDNRVALVVSDNGVGFPPDLDLQHPQSLGLRLVKLLTRQLGGTLELEGRVGTVFKITFADAGR